jgi:hypothetical protein
MHSISKAFLSALAAGTLLAGSVLARDVAPAHTETVKRIVDSPSFKAAADALQKDHDRWIGEVIKLTEILILYTALSNSEWFDITTVAPRLLAMSAILRGELM